MYLWVGCKLPDEFEKEIRIHCLKLNQAVGLSTVAFELPQHISLKISFETDCPDAILDKLEAFLASQTPFDVQVLNAEQSGHILWLTILENETLSCLHQKLDAQLETIFGIPQHEFDKCFKFHSTLFMDSDAGKVTQMCSALKNYPFSRKLHIDTFLLGNSETGAAGTYRVIRKINV